MAVINFANEVMADGPIGFWRLGEPRGSMTAADSSINPITGTLNGHNGRCSPSGIAFGQPGLQGGDTGALFDGVTGRIVVPNSDSLNPSHITMEAKVSWHGSNGFQQRILEKSFFLDPGQEQAEYGLSILDDGRIQVEIRAGGGPSTLTSTAVAALNAETHIAATYDGSMISIYVNGAQKITHAPAFPGDIQSAPSDLGIGNQSVRDRPFNGLIDEVAIYPAALSEERVMAHYQAQFAERVIFQYAAKFVCGTSKGQVVAPGQYFTAINVHNPTYAPLRLRAKLAVALPGLKPGPISGFIKATLGPDAALEIDCPDIFNPKIFPHAPAKAEFLKGFVVIESEVELDVVAVYTAAGSERQVESIHTERVPARSRKAGASEASVDFEPPRG